MLRAKCNIAIQIRFSDFYHPKNPQTSYFNVVLEFISLRHILCILSYFLFRLLFPIISLLLDCDVLGILYSPELD